MTELSARRSPPSGFTKVTARRHRRKMHMHLFPVEIWTNIVEEHLGRRNWLVLSYTCSLLRTVAQASLYRSVYIGRRLDYHDFAASPRTTRFARSVAERPELGDLVRTLTLGATGFEDTGGAPPLHLSSQHPLLLQLASLPNLRILRVANFYVDAEFYSVLYSHPSFRRVSFEFCEIDPALSETEPYNLTGSLKELEVFFPRTVSTAWTAFAPPALQFLHYASRYAALRTILSDVVSRGTYGTLTTLVLGTRGSSFPPSVMPLLSLLPLLQRLSLLWYSRPHPPYLDDSLHPSDLSPHAIPLLKDFSGPAEYAQVFLPGRPVHTVRLCMTMSTPDNVLLSLQLSAVAVTKVSLTLSLTLTPGHLTFCLKHMPLEVRDPIWEDYFIDKTELITWSTAVLPRLTNLRRLEGPGATILHNDETFARALIDACPSLTELVDPRTLAWRRSKGHHWERYWYH